MAIKITLVCVLGPNARQVRNGVPCATGDALRLIVAFRSLARFQPVFSRSITFTAVSASMARSRWRNNNASGSAVGKTEYRSRVHVCLHHQQDG